MDVFRTELHIKKSAELLGLGDRFLSAGSCFASYIADELRVSKFAASVDPFGTVYNPLSIHKLLLYGAQNQTPPQSTFLESNSIYFSYDFHSAFSSLDEIDLKKELTDTINTTHAFLEKCTCLLLTYGTALVYERKDNQEIVANCHKMPASTFTKRLLTPEEISKSFRVMLISLRKINPAIRVIISISPVRHLRDTFELNSVSKAALRLAVNEITKSNERVSYFPAFELLMDDLRDYRFYGPDMIHPSAEAEAYIWQKFSMTYFHDSTMEIIQKWHRIRAALAHHPIIPSSPAHQKFLRETLARLIEMRRILDVETEINEVTRNIAS